MRAVTPRAIPSAVFASLLLACPSEPAKPDAGKTDAKAKAPPKAEAKTDAKVEAKADVEVEAKPEVKPSEPASPPALAPEAEAAIARSTVAFAVDLHKALASRPGNLFVSPASISIAFAMVQAGAAGETADELAKAFHYDGVPDVGAGFAAILARWDGASGGLELDVANRLFGEKTVAFEQPYLDLTGKLFGAPLEPMSFVSEPEPSRERINAWVAERTRDKIKDLMPGGSVTPETRLVLVNAVYFHGKWSDPFEPGVTDGAPFHGTAGDETVKMMHRQHYLQHAVATGASAQLVQLPYEGGEFGMVIVLPDDAKGLPALEQALTAEALSSWIDGVSGKEVALSLPRFTVEPTEALTLRKVLEPMGVRTAFDASKADFTKIAPASAQLVISEAYHKAFVKVDESGTEAAAATAVGMKAGAAAPSEPPVQFVVDRPFLFLIRDLRSGAILFMGRYVDPV